MKKNKYKYNEYVGKTFGNLLIKSFQSLGSGATFKVKCLPCGKDFEIHAHKVLGGYRTGCGCQKGIEIRKRNHENRLDLTEKKFGKLTVLYIDEEKTKKGSSVYWVCQCSCDNKTIKSIKAHHLSEGNTVSCGCKKQDNRGQKNSKWKGYEEISGKFFYKIKQMAIKRNIIFDITIKQIWDLFIKQNKKCALSGLPLNFPSIVGKNDGTASLDRIDSNKGYSIDNIQWLHKNINNIKWDFTQKEIINYCKLVTENQKTQEYNLESRIEYMI